MRTTKTVHWIIGIAAVTIVGFLVMPQIMKKCGSKLYKYSLKKDKIDYENMGPEIVKKGKAEEE